MRSGSQNSSERIANEPITSQKVLPAKEAAQLVGLSESTLAKLRLNGNGPIYCKLGRRVVYRPADLEQWLQSRTARDTSDADARFLKALTLAHPR
jgi:predicted DNA-binding transcriptional regulator AlpA